MTDRTKTVLKRAGLAVLVVGGVALFLGVPEYRRETAERNAPPRWTDKNRWE